MSDYGRVDGPYPDRPSDPWGDEEPYPTHPSPPFGPSEQYGRPPTQYQPERHDPGHPYQQPGGYPDPPGYRRPGGHPDQGGHPDDGGYRNHGAYRDQGGYPGQDNYPGQGGYRDQGGHRTAEPQPAPASWNPPAERPAKKSSTGLIVVLVAVLVLVLCGGGGLALYLLNSKNSTPGAQGRPSAGPHASSATVAASPSSDPRSILKGQCVANDGSEDEPKLRVVDCAPGSYLVLARFDGTDDTGRCQTVPGSTHDYFYQTTPSTLDFVLCLKKQ